MQQKEFEKGLSAPPFPSLNRIFVSISSIAKFYKRETNSCEQSNGKDILSWIWLKIKY